MTYNTDFLRGTTDAQSRVAQLQIDRQQLGVARLTVDEATWLQQRDRYLTEAFAVQFAWRDARAICTDTGDAYSCGWAAGAQPINGTLDPLRMLATTARPLSAIARDPRRTRIVLPDADVPLMIDSGSEGTICTTSAQPQCEAHVRKGMIAARQTTPVVRLGDQFIEIQRAALAAVDPQLWSGLIVGTDVLNQTVWGMDWEKQVLRLGGRVFDVIDRAATWNVIPMDALTTGAGHAPRFVIHVRIAAQDVALMLDSAGEFYASLDSTCFPTDIFQATHTGHVVGQHGIMTVTHVVPPHMTLRDAPTVALRPFEPVLVSDETPEPLQLADGTTASDCGLLGIDFLQTMDFVIDAGTAVFYFRMR